MPSSKTHAFARAVCRIDRSHVHPIGYAGRCVRRCHPADPPGRDAYSFSLHTIFLIDRYLSELLEQYGRIGQPLGLGEFPSPMRHTGAARPTGTTSDGYDIRLSAG